MAGTALEEFTDFVATTGPTYLKSAEDVVNEAVKNNYLLSACLANDAKESIQGGESIKDVILFEDNGSFSTYKPNATFSPGNPQVTDTISVPWRFAKFEYTYTDQEVMLNGGSSQLNRKAKFQQYKKLKRIKEQAAWTSGLNGMEDLITAAPSTSEMETTSGSDPYSLFAFISEDTTNYHPSGWSTIQGVDPAAESRWRNQVSTYDHTSPLDNSDGIITSFDDMIEDVKFEPPQTRREYFENPTLNKCKILTSKQGVTLYKQALRANNDRLVGGTSPQDPDYTNPVYSGIPVKKVDNLSTAAVYTSAVEAAGEPRYYWVNFNYLKLILHADRHFVKKGPMVHPNQPFSYVCYFDVWFNLFCRSRQRHGVCLRHHLPTDAITGRARKPAPSL